MLNVRRVNGLLKKSHFKIILAIFELLFNKICFEREIAYRSLPFFYEFTTMHMKMPIQMINT